MKVKRISKILLTALLVFSLSSGGLAASANTLETNSDISFIRPDRWIVFFHANNIPLGNSAGLVEQVEQRYVENGVTLGNTTPTHAVFTPPTAPAGHFYRFSGWNTQRNGSGDSFTQEQISRLSILKHMWLYAQWALEREIRPEPPSPSPSPTPPGTPQPTPPAITQPTPPPPGGSTPGPGQPSPTPSPAPAPPPRGGGGGGTIATPDAGTPVTDDADTGEPEADTPDEDDIVTTDPEPEDADDEPVIIPIEDAGSPGGAMEFPNEETPLFGGIPLYAQNGTPKWSLLNLILVALGIIIMALALVRRILAENRQKQEESKIFNIEQPPQTHKTLWFIVGGAASVIGIILFIIFQDLTAVMVWVDYLTIAHIVLFAVGVTSAILATRGDKDRDDDGGAEAWNNTLTAHEAHV